MTEVTKPGLLDLEKELTCSICTEVLYQPLTLLDCLHTFCGSCLKEWFSWQASQASASKPNPFTCPSCRASVRETRPNAGVTTLLDMYIQANPNKGRTEQDREEMKKKYTPGENVLPKIRKKKESRDDVEDRRMVDEVREMSLREVGIRASGSSERAVRHQIRDATRDGRDDGARQRRRPERRADAASRGARPSTATDDASRARQIEHQSSLRSLLSSSDVDSSEMEEEILRQIMDEGILDGIDLNNIDVSQEDELSEKIADAYRRRHGQRSRAREDLVEASRATDQRSAQERQHRRPGRSPNPVEQIPHSSHPPVSRPHLLEAYPTGQGHRRRTSSETRRQTSPIPPSSNGRATSETQRQAARSATDLTNRPQSASSQRARPADSPSNNRRTTEPDYLRPRGVSRDRGQTSRSPNGRPREISIATSQSSDSPTYSSPQSSGPGTSAATQRNAVSGNQSASNQRDSPRSSSRTLPPPSIDPPEPPTSYTEPSISCDRCGKKSIEYELHWNCSKCDEGKYNLCKCCYRSGRGCLHWYGFGYATMRRYRNQEPPAGYPPDHTLPHRLGGHCYVRPPPENIQPHIPSSPWRTTSDPKERLQSGPFCSNCSDFTPECHWKCDVCNEGEWGYCNSCVNQGKCCTHALLPVTYIDSKTPIKTSPVSVSPHSSMSHSDLSPNSTADTFRVDQLSAKRHIPLTFSTKCDICTYPIPPSTTRYHCPQCHAGDYDIDSTCYHRLVYNGKIGIENGPKGWRRCPKGHRMIIIGFEDSTIGQRRIVVEDLVGGHALKDDVNADGSLDWSWHEGQQRQMKTVSKASTGRITAVTENPANDGTPPLLKKYPPHGGVGMRIVALWSWWPQEGADDELAFPKGAEIRECEDINGDWFWGVYCARKGLFPADYGRVVEIVGMV